MYYIDNNLAVERNLQRVLFESGEWAVYAAPKIDEPDCFIAYGETNGDPVYFGWYCVDSEFGESWEDVYQDWDGLPFNFETILPHLISHAEDVEIYNNQDTQCGWLTDVECFNQNTGRDIVIDIKLTQHAYSTARPCNTGSPEIVEYEARGIAANGEYVMVSWYVPADIEDLSDFDWDDVGGVDFRY